MVEYGSGRCAGVGGRDRASADKRVQRVIICTPDKDLSQSVRGDRVVQLNRRTGELVRTEPDVVKKFGVGPGSIPDWLALVGDSSDGLPGLAGWGQKSASEVLARFKRLEDIPRDYRQWHANVRNAGALARVLEEQRDLAFLFRDLATLKDGRACLRVGGRPALDWRPAGGRGDCGEDGECKVFIRGTPTSHGFRGLHGWTLVLLVSFAVGAAFVRHEALASSRSSSSTSPGEK